MPESQVRLAELPIPSTNLTSESICSIMRECSLCP